MSSALRRTGRVIDDLSEELGDRLHAAVILLLVLGLALMATAFDAVTMLKR